MPPRCKTQQAICNYDDKMYDTKHTRYKHDANMKQIDHGIDVLQSLMEQLSNKHGASMQEGLKKKQRDRPLPSSKQWPKVLKMVGNQLMLTSKFMVPKLRHKRRQLTPIIMTTHGMIKASKNRILQTKIGPQTLLIWQLRWLPRGTYTKAHS